MAALNLLRLSVFTGDERYRRRADAVFSAASDPLERAPAAFPRLLCALDFRSDPPREVVLAGTPGREDFERLRRDRLREPASEPRGGARRYGGGRGRSSRRSARAAPRPGADAAAYVCSNFACRAPVSDPEALRASLEAP